MKLIDKISLVAIFASSFFLASCDKTELYDTTEPAPASHFVGSSSQTYSVVVNPPPVYNVVVGSTNVTNTDRNFGYKVTSPSGAVPGTHYTIATGNTSGNVVIPAGSALGNIAVQANYASYQTGRRDTLIFTLTDGSAKIPGFTDTVRLELRGPCFEGNVNVAAMLGAYPNTTETFGTGAPYGPYLTTITSAVSTGATTATIVVSNIWDNGWGPITFNLDWTDPAVRTATVVPQTAIPGSNAGDLSATYAGQTVAVRPFATGNVGTFSACNSTFTLRMQLGVTGVGYFGNLYQVNMRR